MKVAQRWKEPVSLNHFLECSMEHVRKELVSSQRFRTFYFKNYPKCVGQWIPCSIFHGFGHRTRQTGDANLTPEGGLPFAHTLAKNQTVLTSLLNCLLFVYSSASPSNPAETVFFTDRLWFPAPLSTPRGALCSPGAGGKGPGAQGGARGTEVQLLCQVTAGSPHSSLSPHSLCWDFPL